MTLMANVGQGNSESGAAVDADARQGPDGPTRSDQEQVDAAQPARAHPTWLVDPWPLA